MSCSAKLRNDIKDRGKPSIEFYWENKPRYFCYGYINQRTDELIEECRNCPEHVYKAGECMEKLRNGEKPTYDGLRKRTKNKKAGGG